MQTTRVSLLRVFFFSFLFLKKKRKTGVALLSYGGWEDLVDLGTTVPKKSYDHI